LTLIPKGTASVRVAQAVSGANGLILNQDIGATANSARLFLDSSSGTSSIWNPGGNAITFRTNASIGSTSGTEQFRIIDTASAVNYHQFTGSTTGNAVVHSVAGSDTNIDLAFTPKGTGNVRFGTYTANMALTIQGYVEIKDSGGTVRRLAVIA